MIDTSGCQVTQKKTKSSDGYSALQVGFGSRKQQNLKKPQAGHFKKAGVGSKALVREIRVESDEEITHLKPGDTLVASMFSKGDRVDVIGMTRGKGFQGVVKRYGFHGADASHGVHEYFRHAGSAGTNTFPGKILKNKGMPGQTGNALRTIRYLEVVDVKPKENLIFLRGAVPGARNGIVLIRTSKKAKNPEKRSWTSES